MGRRCEGEKEEGEGGREGGREGGGKEGKRRKRTKENMHEENVGSKKVQRSVGGRRGRIAHKAV